MSRLVHQLTIADLDRITRHFLKLDRALLHARNCGVAELFMHSLRENAAIRHIAQRAGMRIVTDANEADAFLELPPATPMTLGQELYLQQCALIDWTLMNQMVVRTQASRKAQAARPSSTLPGADSSRSRRVSP